MGSNLAKYFDHTVLKYDTSLEEIKKLCSEAKEHNFFAVCVPPNYVVDAKIILKGSDVKVATVVGFPMGYQKTVVKCLETKLAIEEGADEIDMVINTSAFKDGALDLFEQDILSVNSICEDYKIPLKVIIESGNLSLDAIQQITKICVKIGVAFVKTSTGFFGTGATVDAVKMIKSEISEGMQIKASGGIRTADFMNELIEAGADRIGASASVKIIQE